MKKKIIISLITLAAITALGVAGYYLLRGSLIINGSPLPFSVTIRKKTYDVKDKFEKSLLIGPHKITVKKDFYDDIILNPNISLNQTTEENINFSLNNDGETLMSMSENITAAWINFTSNGDKNTFLSEMEKYLKPDSFDSFKENIEQANTTNGAGITTEIQQIYGPIKSKSIKKRDDGGAEVTVVVTKKNNNLSTKKLIIGFTNEGGEWQSDNITYIY